MQPPKNDHSIAFLTYSNFLSLESNTRLISYYNYILEHGQKPIFLFLKGYAQTSYSAVQSKKTGIKGLWSQYIALYQFIKHSKSLKLLYIYSPFFLFRPLEKLAQKKGIRVVKERTEIDSLKPTQTLKDRILKQLYVLDERKATRDAHVVITPQIAGRLGLTDYVLIPAFIETSLYDLPAQTKRNDSEVTFGYYGSFGPKDRVEKLLNTLNKIQNYPIRVRLIGNLPKNMSHLKQKEWNFKIDWVSNVHTRDAIKELSVCDMAICHRDSSEYSTMGFPSKLMEYMLAHANILCADTGNIKQHMQNTEITFYNPEDENALLSSIQNFLDHRETVDHNSSIERHHFKTYASTWYDFVFTSK